MEQKKLSHAQQLIKDKKYADAESLLSTMLDNDNAMKWYLQIQQLVLMRNLNTESKKISQSTNSINRIIMLITAIIFLVTLVSFLGAQNSF